MVEVKREGRGEAELGPRARLGSPRAPGAVCGVVVWSCQPRRSLGRGKLFPGRSGWGKEGGSAMIIVIIIKFEPLQ